MKSGFLIVFLFLSVMVYGQTPSSCHHLDGVWEHEHASMRGIWFYKDDKYLWIILPKLRLLFAGDQPTIEEKAKAYDELSISTGSWACDGKRVTVTQMFSKNPANNTSFQFDYEISEMQIKYWIIQPDGNRGEERHSKKLTDFNPPAKQGCDQMNGFWEYDLPNQTGRYAYANGYFGWILLDRKVTSTGLVIQSIEEKANAYDQILAVAGKGVCDTTQRYSWTRLYTKDYREEGTISRSDIKFQNDRVQWWYVDAAGKRLETGGKAKRLK